MPLSKLKQEIMSCPRSSGIYYIADIYKNKYYVGSSNNIKERLKKHRINLIKNKHHTRYLQRFFNKYGEDYLTAGIMKLCNKDLLKKEYFYIKKLQKLGKIIFNSVLDPSKGGGSNRFRKYTKYSFINLKTGKSLRGYNIASLSTKLKMEPSGFYHLLSGKKKKYGYYILESNLKNYTEYRFINSKGREFKTRLVEDLCRKYKLSLGHMIEIWNGTRTSHKGWTKYNQDTTRTYLICDISGNIIKVNSIYRFCYKNKLKPSIMLNLLNGKIKVYRGFKYIKIV